MKNLFIITLLTLGVNYVNAQQIDSTNIKENSPFPNPCGCIELSEVKNENNPGEILIGAKKCIELKDYKKAVRLFAIAGVYGIYDTYRVKDKSAHQIVYILKQTIFQAIEESERNNFFNILMTELKMGSKELSDLCQTIQQIGIPKYHPTYMINHGMGAIIEPEKNSLNDAFNSTESFNLALKKYLHCGE